MSLKFITEQILEDTADAIRAKTGGTAAITPADFPDEIASIPSGGGDTFEDIMLTRTVTEYTNGTITELPVNALRYTPLKKLTLSALSKFSSYAFGNSDFLEEVYFPAVDANTTVSRLGYGSYAFEGCSRLWKVSMPHAKMIPDSCFMNCIKLTNIDMPEVRDIRGNAFNGAIAANTITPIELSFPALRDLNGTNIFYDAKVAKVNMPILENIAAGAFAGAKFLTELELPSSMVTKALNRLCYGCTAMTKFVCRAPITTISSQCFANCSACLEFDFSACTAVPTLQNTSCFQKINANAVIKVPAALESEWKAATNWATFASQIQGV